MLFIGLGALAFICGFVVFFLPDYISNSNQKRENGKREWDKYSKIAESPTHYLTASGSCPYHFGLCNVVILTFENFKKLYVVNPNDYIDAVIDNQKGYVVKKNDEDNNFLLVFATQEDRTKYIDFFNQEKERKKKEAEDRERALKEEALNENYKAFLEDAIEDINKLKEQASSEIDEAAETFTQIKQNIDLNQVKKLY